MKQTGIELIAQERQEQIEKHGYSVDHDIKHERNENLLGVATCLIRDQWDGHYWYPESWKVDKKRNFRAKVEAKRARMTAKEFKIACLKIAGALLAAEIDRLQGGKAK